MDKSVTYIALLRGINVGGHRPLKMEDLRELFSSMGFKNISTYIQSGNIIFDASKQNNDRLGGRIKEQIADTFGYDVPVLIFSAADFKNVAEKFPFQQKEGWKRYITFLSDQPTKEQHQKLEAQSSEIESFRIGNRVVYIHVDKQTDRKLLFSSSFIQKRLRIPATTRNLRTVHKLLELAGASE